MIEPIFCEDCKWFRPVGDANGVCMNPQSAHVHSDNITRTRNLEHHCCGNARGDYMDPLLCGPEAAWFEPKPPKPIKRSWWRNLKIKAGNP